MIEILRKMFEANSGKSTIQIKGKCSDCGREIIISITSTAGGFGLQGGSFFISVHRMRISPSVRSVIKKPKDQGDGLMETGVTQLEV